MRIHLIGIGGSGMSGLALWCCQRGDNVSGSDQNLSASSLTRLSLHDIAVSTQHSASNIPTDCDVVIHTSAIPAGNEELVEAKQRISVVKSYFEYLGDISQTFPTIAIAGTHGKSTTTALICYGLKAARLPFHAFLGAQIAAFSTDNSNYDPQAKFLVVEACEYKRNFLFLKPKIVVLTAVDYDHVDVFPTEQDYISAFCDFVQTSEYLIYHSDCPASRKIADTFTGEKIVVGDAADEPLSIFGRCNQRNARLAIVLYKQMIGMPCFEKLESLESYLNGIYDFPGVSRRQELIGLVDGVRVYDDFAHHPVELECLIEAFTHKFPTSKIGVVLQIHQNSRANNFFNQFIDSLNGVYIVGLFPVHLARETRAASTTFSIERYFEVREDWFFIQSFDDVDKYFFDKSREKYLNVGDILLVCSANGLSISARIWMDTKNLSVESVHK